MKEKKILIQDIRKGKRTNMQTNRQTKTVNPIPKNKKEAKRVSKEEKKNINKYDA